ncbi:MAG: hypothetical protein U0572_12370 [Phycisphaerales bacterium]
MGKLMRILAAGIVGGLVMFIWGAVSHMVLQMGTGGMRGLPNEAALIAPMQAVLKERAIYYAPWNEAITTGKEMTEAEGKAYEERHRNGPVAFIVWQPVGGEMMPPSRLLNEYLSNAAAAMLAAIVLASGLNCYWSRVLACVLIGLAGWLSISVSEWNWWNFPWEYIRDEGVDQAIGWLLSGFAIAAIAPRCRKSAPSCGTAAP